MSEGVVPLGTEALDDPATDPGLVAHMLADIARANRWLGGRAAVRGAMAMLLADATRGRAVTLLDVGTGAGDLPAYLTQWSARRGVPLRPIGLERIPAAARIAQQTGLPTMLACASALPVRAKSVDIVLISQVAHHLADAKLAALLDRASAAARRGVIVADLHPSQLSELGFRLVGTVFGWHQTTIADGVTSLRRGFTPTRLRAVCESAQPNAVQVTRSWGSRIVAWWRVDGGGKQ